MLEDEALAFAERWSEAWNGRDLEGVLSHFAEDVIFTSQRAVQFLGGDGLVRGKAALRAYWTEALRRQPDLRFEVLAVYNGVHTIVINFRNHLGGLVTEVLTFEDGLVVQGHAAHLGRNDSPAKRAQDQRS